MVGGVGGGYNNNQNIEHAGGHIHGRGERGHRAEGHKGHVGFSEEGREALRSTRDDLRAFIKGDGDRSGMVDTLQGHVDKLESMLAKAQENGHDMPKLEEKLNQMKSLLSEVSTMDPQELNAMDGEALWAIFQGNSESTSTVDGSETGTTP